MKINDKIDFSDTMNLPKKTISTNADITKKESFFLARIQEVRRYREVVNKNKDSNNLYNILENPMEIKNELSPTYIQNKILKDIVIRYKLLNGEKANHNLDFVNFGNIYYLKKTNDFSSDIEEIVNKRENKRLELIGKIKKQTQKIKDLGTIINYSNVNSSTLNSDFDLKVIDKFFELYKQKKLYHELMPIKWCTRCQISLNEQNISNKEEKLNNIFLTFKIKEDNGIFRGISSLQNTYFVTSTTTPWILDFDNTLAIVEDMEYSIVEVKQKDKTDYYVIASDYVEYVMETAFFIRFSVRKKVIGKELVGVICNNILDNAKDLKVISAKKEHVILDSKKSSGIAIVSSGNTSSDFLISKYNNSLSIKNNLDKEGKAIQAYNFNNFYYKEINDKVLEIITNKGRVLCSDNVKLKVSKCSKCNEEIIYRNEEVWYIKKNENEELLKQVFNEVVSRISADDAKKEELNKRLCSSINKKKMVISDQDIFGIPVPIFYCTECSSEVITDTSIEILKQVFKEGGLKEWYNKTSDEILQGKVTCDKCGNSMFFKRNSYINEFFKSICIDLVKTKKLNDSNIVQKNICIENEKEFIKKIKDISFDDRGLSDLKNINKILLHPEVKIKDSDDNVKREEIKMQDEMTENTQTKKGSTFNFESIIKKYGVDVLRLWCIQNSKKQISIVDEFSVTSSLRVYRKLRNTMKFILSNLYDFNPSKNMVHVNDRDDLDKYMYVKLVEMKKIVDKKYDELDLNNLVIDVLKYCEDILSNKYFEVAKYRLYVLNANDSKRRSTQSTFYEIFMTLLNFLEPILPFTFEETWSYIWHINSEEESNLLLHRNKLEQIDIHEFEQSIKKWNNIFFIIKRVNIQINKAINKKKIKNSLQARVILGVNQKTKEFIDTNHEDFLRALNVSILNTQLSERSSIVIETADGIECKMCKNYSIDIGKDINYRHLCPVCAKIMSKKN